MNCDSIAFCYRHLEHLVYGRALEQRRQEYIAEVTDAQAVLILGDGDGRFTEKFMMHSLADRIDSVERSERMLSLARRRVDHCPSGQARLHFHESDARRISLPSGKYDLIVTHFFLDCFTPADLSALIARLSQFAHSRSRWLVSEFRVPDRGLRRFAGALLIKLMYLFFKVSTGLEANHLPDYAALLACHGFRRTHAKNAWGGLLVSELWERC